MNQTIGYDELLADRVKQLKDIEERLERIESAPDIVRSIRSLRNDVNLMIQHAEDEHTAF